MRRMLAIPFKKTDTRLVPIWTRTKLQALLDAPDPATREGIRDRAMLHLAVCAGLRVSELTGLCTPTWRRSRMSIRVRGKGRRERALPLWKTTAVGTARLAGGARNSRRAGGVRQRARRAVQSLGSRVRAPAPCRYGEPQLPSLRSKQISPHVLRHTCAMIVLQATQDIRKVSLWLGHSTLATTEIYLFDRVNLAACSITCGARSESSGSRESKSRQSPRSRNWIGSLPFLSSTL